MMKKIALFMLIWVLGTVVVATGSMKVGGNSRISIKGVPILAMVSIGGHVKWVGPVAFQPGMTVLQVVQAAGGITPFGTRRRIYLTRGKDRIKLDLRKPEHQFYPVKLGDTIVVDQKGALFWR